MMTDERIEAALGRCKAATEGPWIQTPYSLLEYGRCSTIMSWQLRQGGCDGDRRFIAHARQDLPDALLALKDARAALAKIIDDAWTLSEAEAIAAKALKDRE